MTHYPAETSAGAAAHDPDPVVVVAVLVFVGLLLAVVVVSALLSTRGDRRRLRRCPLCAADAVRDQRSVGVDWFHARADIQCGQCGTWRRVVTTRAELDQFSRRLTHDRCVIADLLALTPSQPRRGSPLS